MRRICAERPFCIQSIHARLVLFPGQRGDELYPRRSGLAGVIADVPSSMPPKGTQETLEGRRQPHAVTWNQRVQKLDPHSPDRNSCHCTWAHPEVQGVDPPGDKLTNRSVYDRFLVFGPTQQQSSSGIVAADDIANGDSPHIMLGRVGKSDQARTVPAGDRTRTASIVGRGEEMQWVQQHIIVRAQVFAQGLDLVPMGHKAARIAQDLSSQMRGRRHSKIMKIRYPNIWMYSLIVFKQNVDCVTNAAVGALEGPGFDCVVNPQQCLGSRSAAWRNDQTNWPIGLIEPIYNKFRHGWRSPCAPFASAPRSIPLVSLR